MRTLRAKCHRHLAGAPAKFGLLAVTLAVLRFIRHDAASGDRAAVATHEGPTMISIERGTAGGEGPRLNVLRQPVAGEIAEIHVAEMPGPVRVDVSSHGVTLLSHDCNDPPCHESFLVPSGTSGSHLVVHVIDGHGGVLHDNVSIEP